MASFTDTQPTEEKTAGGQSYNETPRATNNRGTKEGSAVDAKESNKKFLVRMFERNGKFGPFFKGQDEEGYEYYLNEDEKVDKNGGRMLIVTRTKVPSKM